MRTRRGIVGFASEIAAEEPRKGLWRRYFGPFTMIEEDALRSRFSHAYGHYDPATVFSGEGIMAQCWMPEPLGATVGGMSHLHHQLEPAITWRSHPIARAIAEAVDSLDDKRAGDIELLLASLVEAARDCGVSYPPLRLSKTDDDAVIIEWAFEDRRLGVAYERDEGESGWYFVLRNETMPPEYGPLRTLEANLSRLIRRCLEAV